MKNIKSMKDEYVYFVELKASVKQVNKLTDLLSTNCKIGDL